MDSGAIKFIPRGGAGIMVSGQIVDGKYQFTPETGVPAGKYQVEIFHYPPRDPAYKGRKHEAPILEETRFKKEMPETGWLQEVEVAPDQRDPIDFHLHES